MTTNLVSKLNRIWPWLSENLKSSAYFRPFSNVFLRSNFLWHFVLKIRKSGFPKIQPWRASESIICHFVSFLYLRLLPCNLRPVFFLVKWIILSLFTFKMLLNEYIGGFKQAKTFKKYKVLIISPFNRAMELGKKMWPLQRKLTQ